MYLNKNLNDEFPNYVPINSISGYEFNFLKL